MGYRWFQLFIFIIDFQLFYFMTRITSEYMICRYKMCLLYFTRDILLLEAGFLAILVAPLNIQLPKKFRMPIYHEHDTILLWLVKWLLFRLMFASGVVKLTSGCPTWWGLTGKRLIIDIYLVFINISILL